jgi:hypothetical protein
MPTFTSLHGVHSVAQPLLSEQLESNLLYFFQWGLLGIGAFENVTIPTSGAYGGDMHRLRKADDPNYDDGQVWEAFRRDWVWETGVDCPFQPIRVSGVYVDGHFHPATGVGPYAHAIDYPNGRVIFGSGLPTDSVVSCEYSYRNYHVTTADAPWWREIQQGSLRVDDTHFLQEGSGAWSILSQSRVQLPAVVIEAVPRTSRYGTAIGGGTTVGQEVRFDILAEDRSSRNKLHDIITYQWNKRLVAFDKEAIVAADRFPLDPQGSPTSGALMYPQLLDQFGWRQLRWMETRSGAPSPRATAPLYSAAVVALFEVDLP